MIELAALCLFGLEVWLLFQSRKVSQEIDRVRRSFVVLDGFNYKQALEKLEGLKLVRGGIFVMCTGIYWVALLLVAGVDSWMNPLTAGLALGVAVLLELITLLEMVEALMEAE